MMVKIVDFADIFNDMLCKSLTLNLSWWFNFIMQLKVKIKLIHLASTETTGKAKLSVIPR